MSGLATCETSDSIGLVSPLRWRRLSWLSIALVWVREPVVGVLLVVGGVVSVAVVLLSPVGVESSTIALAYETALS